MIFPNFGYVTDFCLNDEQTLSDFERFQADLYHPRRASHHMKDRQQDHLGHSMVFFCRGRDILQNSRAHN